MTHGPTLFIERRCQHSRVVNLRVRATLALDTPRSREIKSPLTKANSKARILNSGTKQRVNDSIELA